LTLIERAFRERIVLVGVTIPPATTGQTEALLDELSLLVDTAGADEAERRTVGARARAHQPSDLHLVERRGDARERLDAQPLRDLVEEILDAGDADRVDHRRDIGLRVGNEGHQPPSASSTRWYSAAVRSAAPESAPATGFSRISHPSP